MVKDLNQPMLFNQVHEDLPYRWADMIWAAQSEMALQLDDILSRRTRCLLCNAKASMEIAPKVADLVAGYLGWDENQKQAEIEKYQQIASAYLWESNYI
jgi:glycerol-3-phosphate dehydrogenase